VEDNGHTLPGIGLSRKRPYSAATSEAQWVIITLTVRPALFDAIHGQQGQTQITDTRQQPKQRRLIGDHTAQHGFSVDSVADRHLAKPIGPVSVKVAANSNLVIGFRQHKRLSVPEPISPVQSNKRILKVGYNYIVQKDDLKDEVHHPSKQVAEFVIV